MVRRPINIQVEGVDKAVSDLKAWELRKRGALGRSVVLTLIYGESYIKRLISRPGPSLPGEPPGVGESNRLRSGYHWRIESLHAGEVYTNVEYAPMLEYGTGRAGLMTNRQTIPEGYTHGPSPGMAARPHAGPTAEAMRTEFVRHAAEALKP